MKSCKRVNKKLVKARKTKKAVAKRGGYLNTNSNYLILQYKGDNNNPETKHIKLDESIKSYIAELNTMKTKYHSEMDRLKSIQQRGNAYALGIQNTIDEDYVNVQTKYRTCEELLQLINNSDSGTNKTYIFENEELAKLFLKPLPFYQSFTPVRGVKD